MIAGVSWVVYLVKYRGNNWWKEGTFYNCIRFTSTTFLAISIFAILIINICGPFYIIDYKQSCVEIELAVENSQLTGAERASAISTAVFWNKKIALYKAASGGIWLNWFAYKPIAELPFFDLHRIQKANTKVEIN